MIAQQEQKLHTPTNVQAVEDTIKQIRALRQEAEESLEPLDYGIDIFGSSLKQFWPLFFETASILVGAWFAAGLVIEWIIWDWLIPYSSQLQHSSNG